MPNTGGKVSGVALASILFGTVFVYAGYKGYSILKALQNVIGGKSLGAGQTASTGLTTVDVAVGSASSSGGTVTSSAIASDAQKYVGQGYQYGGPSSPGKWDCSSFVSYVLGHDLGIALPGGSWSSVTANGTQHGPDSTAYMSFGTAVNLANAQPGDIVATPVHMGIVIGNGQMVSAENEQLGTGIGSYTSGFPGGTPVCRSVG